MNGNLRIGRIAGVVVRAHWSVLVIAALIAQALAVSVLPSTAAGLSSGTYWAVGIADSVLFLVSLLAHELSHAVVARRHGMVVKDITLWMLGGVTAIEGDAHEASTALRVAAAGPLVSALCCGVSLGAAATTAALNGPNVVTAGFVWLSLTNGLLAVFNLLPGAPLDGGRILQAVLWKRSGDRFAAINSASRAGRSLGAALIFLGAMEVLLTSDLLAGIWLALIGWFVLQAATAEGRLATVEHDFRGVAVDEAMETSFAMVASWQPLTAAAREAVAADCDYCAVLGLDGDLETLVAVDLIVAASKQPGEHRVRDISKRFPPPRRVEVGSDLAESVTSGTGTLPIAVIREGHLEGIVTPASLHRAMRRREVTSGSGPA